VKARSPVAPLLAVIVLWVVSCQPSYADSLDDALACGIKAYSDTQPPAGDWAKQLVSELKEDADESEQEAGWQSSTGRTDRHV